MAKRKHERCRGGASYFHRTLMERTALPHPGPLPLGEGDPFAVPAKDVRSATSQFAPLLDGGGFKMRPCRSTLEGMELEFGRSARFRVQRNGEVAAVLEQFDAGERWERGAQTHVERPPVAGFVQRPRHLLDGVAEELDNRHARQPPAFPEIQI